MQDNNQQKRGRGRPRGSKNKVFNKPEETDNIKIKRGRGRPKGSKNKKKQKGGLVRSVTNDNGWTQYYKTKSEKANCDKCRMADGTKYIVYELIDINKNQYYVGQTTDFSARESHHRSDGKIKKYYQNHGIESNMNIIEQQFFCKSECDSGIAKQWLDDREAFWMMYYGQHKYNSKSMNTNVPVRLEESMNDCRERLENIWKREHYNLFESEKQLRHQLEKTLDNYYEYCQKSTND